MSQAVIFDLFETLVTENYPEWHAEAASPAQALGIDAQAFSAAWKRAYLPRMTGHYPDYAAVLRAICAELGVVVDVETIDTLQHARMAAKARPFARVEPDILTMLDTLRTDGWQIGVITNCAFDEVNAWAESPLAQRVDCPIFSCAVGMVKPEQPIYGLACRELGCEPAQAIFVGDGGSDELRGARAAGLQAIWATWFIERWPWDWVASVANAADGVPRCRTPLALPALATGMG